jgi:hypothetical protein
VASCRIPLVLDGCFTPVTHLAAATDLEAVTTQAGWSRPLRECSLQAFSEAGYEVAAQVGSAGIDLVFAEPVSGPLRLTLVLEDAPPAAPRVVFSQGLDRVEISVDGVRWATYRYNTTAADLPRPYFHPILGPGAAPFTQDGEFPGTNRGHIWHTGLVLAHQSFTDGNNWQTGSPNYSRMRHVAFDAMESGPAAGRFVERLDWLNVKGDRVVFREVRTVTVPYRSLTSRIIDVETAITCGDQPAVWNATPYQLLAIRLPDGMLVGKGGVLTNSEDGVSPKDGTPAKWLDYSGPVGAQTAGVAILDHPSNPRHPTPFLNFQNQTIGAAPTHREPYSWKPGETLLFRYRVLFHSGNVHQGRVAEEFAAFAVPPRARVETPTLIA